MMNTCSAFNPIEADNMPHGSPIATYPSMMGTAAPKAAFMFSAVNTNGDYTCLAAISENILEID